MGASQRHKCEIHDFTVIADGSCPAYATPTYPPGSAVVVVEQVIHNGDPVMHNGEEVTHGA